MKVQIQLRKLLQDRGLDRRGIIQKISASTKLDRRVIAKYYNDEAPTVSLSVVRELCVWLSRHGVPMDSLPGSLFGLAHTELWPALAERGRVDLYLGEYLHVPGASPAVSSVSRRDAAVAADFVHQFSVPRVGEKRCRFFPIQHKIGNHLIVRSSRINDLVFYPAEKFHIITAVEIGW